MSAVDKMGAITETAARKVASNAINPSLTGNIDLALKNTKGLGPSGEKTSVNKLISGRTIQRMSIQNGGSINSDRRYIAKFENLCFINCLPPPANSIVDPPPLLSEADISKPLQVFEDICGRDYVDRVLMRGQYLILVPLDMQPTALKLARDKFQPFVKLDNVMDRLDISSYGYTAKVNSKKYNRAVTALLQSALLALGFEIGDDNLIDKEFDRNFFPDHIIDRMYGGSRSYCNPFAELANGTGLSGLPPAGEKTDPGGNPDQTFLDDITKSMSGQQPSGTIEAENAQYMKELTDMENDKARFNTDAAKNMIRFLTNIDMDDQINKNMPWVVFYINGGLTRSIDTQSTLNESAIGKAMSDIGAKMVQGAANNAEGAAGKVAGALANNTTEEMLKEAAYHNPNAMLGAASFLVENTYIPNVIKETMLDMQYTVPLRQTCSCGDPYSLFRPLYVLCQLLPFVVPTNTAGSAAIIPEAPMYCSAFVKGQMNLPKAAITSMSIRTSPMYQTSEGIPMELDIELTIKPLQSMSTMPNFDTIFTRNMDQTRIIAQMFNPISPFNIIATLAGQNTVLSKFPYGLFYYFTVGNLKAVYTNIKGVGSYISDAYVDFMGTALSKKSRILSIR